MPRQNVVESVNETDQRGFGGVLLGGFSSIIDGVTLFGQLTLQQQLRDQFPEQFPPVSTTFVNDSARGELAVANRPGGFTLGSVIDSVKQANPLVIGGVVAGVIALVIALK